MSVQTGVQSESHCDRGHGIDSGVHKGEDAPPSAVQRCATMKMGRGEHP